MINRYRRRDLYNAVAPPLAWLAIVVVFVTLLVLAAPAVQQP